MIRCQARPTLFPYTTLFRSGLTLRNLCNHYGPVNRHETELRGDANDMFQEVQDHMDESDVPEPEPEPEPGENRVDITDRKSTRLNSSHLGISYAVFCLKKKR